ncbi:MAG: EamA family transporter [Acidobacteria bacterium]|nr:EamA family transporter [Acidobacteriota bacterium]
MSGTFFLFGFTTFIPAPRLLPATVGMTYAYVNTFFAVILCWLILSEPITNCTVLGTPLILIGVYGVFRGKGKMVSQE